MLTNRECRGNDSEPFFLKPVNHSGLWGATYTAVAVSVMFPRQDSMTEPNHLKTGLCHRSILG